MKRNLLLFTSLAMLWQTQAKDLFVMPEANGDGSSWESTMTLQKALDISEAGDILHLAGGTYVPEKEIIEGNPRSRSFYISKPITLLGGYSLNPKNGEKPDLKKNKSILSGLLDQEMPLEKNAYRVVVVAVENSTDDTPYVVLDGLSVQDGNAVDSESIPGFGPKKGGGLIASSSRIRIQNCEFLNNQGNAEGAAFQFYNCNGIVENCLFQNNKSLAMDAGNKPKGNTGVIYFWGKDVSIKNCIVKENMGRNGVFGFGGGITAEISNSTFMDNSVGNVGAGIYMKDNVVATMNNCTVLNNLQNMGAIYLHTKCTLTLNGCVVKGNTGEWGAGVALKDASHLIANETVFEENKTHSNKYDGGAISAEENAGTLLFTRCSFLKNEAKKGAAVRIKQGYTATFEECIFQENLSRVEGACASIEVGAKGNFNNCIFEQNMSNRQAPALFVHGAGSEAMINNCRFENNRRMEYTGGYDFQHITALSGSVINIYNSLIKNNKVDTETYPQHGLAVANSKSTLNLINTTITGCKGLSMIYTDSDGKTTLTSCTIVDNEIFGIPGNNGLPNTLTIATDSRWNKGKYHIYNTLLANNMNASEEGGISASELIIQNSIHGNMVYNQSGNLNPDLQFNRNMMLAQTPETHGVTEYFPYTENLPSQIAQAGMNAEALSHLAGELKLPEDIMITDQRGVARKGNYIGAFTAGIVDDLNSINTNDILIETGKGMISVRNNEAGTLIVYNINGIVIYSAYAEPGSHTITTGESGIFFIRFNEKTNKVVL
ncbi:MAG: right-handed parallel beta-helix repeat-containing protein [Bacteroidales bacterium]